MIWIWALFFILSGCTGFHNQSLSTEALSEENTYNLSRVSIGMNEEQVLRIMRHPYSQKTFEYNGDVYDVWFYVTRVTTMDQSRLLPQNLTPLTFKNRRLVGWGYAYYNYLLKREHPGTRIQAAPPSEQPEGDGIEKVLETPSRGKPQTTPTKQKPPTSGQSDQQYEYPETIIPIQAPPGPPAKPTQEQTPQPPSSPPVAPRGPQPPPPPIQPKPPMQPAAPKQPQSPKQPPSPTQPPVENQRPFLGFLAMCSRPTSSPPKPVSEELDDNSVPNDKEEKPTPYLDEDGEKMIEEENEQNFDFW